MRVKKHFCEWRLGPPETDLGGVLLRQYGWVSGRLTCGDQIALPLGTKWIGPFIVTETRESGADIKPSGPPRLYEDKDFGPTEEDARAAAKVVLDYPDRLEYTACHARTCARYILEPQ